MKPRLRLRIPDTAKRYRLRVPDTAKRLRLRVPTPAEFDGIEIELTDLP